MPLYCMQYTWRCRIPIQFCSVQTMFLILHVSTRYYTAVYSNASKQLTSFDNFFRSAKYSHIPSSQLKPKIAIPIQKSAFPKRIKKPLTNHNAPHHILKTIAAITKTHQHLVTRPHRHHTGMILLLHHARCTQFPTPSWLNGSPCRR